jgi:hypothetical protein
MVSGADFIKNNAPAPLKATSDIHRLCLVPIKAPGSDVGLYGGVQNFAAVLLPACEPAAA